jgi:hypothetical protein
VFGDRQVIGDGLVYPRKNIKQILAEKCLSKDHHFKHYSIKLKTGEKKSVCS